MKSFLWLKKKKSQRRKQWIIKLLQEKRADSECFKYDRPLILLLTSFGADFFFSFFDVVVFNERLVIFHLNPSKIPYN